MTRPTTILAVALLCLAGCGEAKQDKMSQEQIAINRLEHRVKDLERRANECATQVNSLTDSLEALVNVVVSERARWTVGGELGFLVKQLFLFPTAADAAGEE